MQSEDTLHPSSLLRAFKRNRGDLDAQRKLSQHFPLHFPLRRLDRDAPTAQLMTAEEQRPVGWLPLWPYLYRAYDADVQPLYIGISSCSPVRLDNHRRLSEWWPLAEYIAISAYGTARAVEEAERAALRNEQPRFNKRGVRGPANVSINAHGDPEAAAAHLFRQASPEFIAALADLLLQPGRFPQPVPPPPAQFAPEEAQ
ncbi:GIY-YIG nuclease family protein [Streptomyces sp. CFMR 7]|uniref:GIY-YIG nuclease family protein n=1 Tax=Streptomyces sp. CFMR 7 TaxID=1649184 RepID=UPI0011A9E3AB|nr:GIY-YIG nuclease family protein [Streptomyces sp. CFMR 7]